MAACSDGKAGGTEVPHAVCVVGTYGSGADVATPTFPHWLATLPYCSSSCISAVSSGSDSVAGSMKN